MMTEKEVIELFESNNALLKGHFVLSSGRHSDRYLQCALLLQNPSVAEQLCRALASRIFRSGLSPDFIVGPALGGILVSYEIARQMKVKSLFTERDNGVMTLRRGFTVRPGDKYIIVEDVITTGKSTMEVKKVIDGLGGEMIGAASLVDRSGGADIGFRPESLLQLDIETFDPQDCPICRQGIPAIKPGSRPQAG